MTHDADADRTRAGLERVDAWKRLDEGLTKIERGPLTEDQITACKEVRSAMLHLLEHETMPVVKDPEREVDMETQHVLNRRGRALPLTGKQRTLIRTRFAPPLILLKSLNDICAQFDRTEAESPPASSHQTPEQNFHTFVDKVSQICDYDLHGRSFTSCVVLQKADGVLYLLASNDRNTEELQDVRTKLISVLDVLKENIVANAKDRKSDDDLSDCLLRLVLTHNKVRIRSYLTRLSAALRDCVAICNRGEQNEESKLLIGIPQSELPAVG